MAVTFATGLEAQAVSVDFSQAGAALSGTAAYSTAQHRTGAASVRCNPASSAQGFINLNGAVAGWWHFGLFVASAPTLDRYIAGNATGVGLMLTSTSALKFMNANAQVGSTTAALSAGWHWIGMRTSTGTSVDFLQVDGVAVVTATATVSSPGLGAIGCSASEASAIDIYFDDIIADGAGFIAPSNVDIAFPISDSTRTAVTAGAGGTTNLWDAVNNTPPAGVASASETNTSNIKFPASVSGTYAANLETYTTLGIGASDTFLGVQSVFRHGEDIATGTKTCNLPTVTNPTFNDAGTFTFGNDAGAHAAEVGLWVTVLSTFRVGGTDITLGSSPVIRFDRVSEARVGCIDFMGLLVAWTPAAVAQVPYVNPMPPLLAQ